jgi:hypothetical protein
LPGVAVSLSGGNQQVGSPDNHNPEPPDEKRSGAFSDPVGRLVPRELQKKNARPLPFAGLLTGNRDWVISIECGSDALVLHPSEQRIAVSDLTATGAGTSLLVERIQELIARRQASVRPGETAYRPIIRFRVRPDGVRAYYLAYPILAPLNLPMLRENMDNEN